MTWHRVGTVHEVNEGDMKQYAINGKDITLAKVQGQLFAFDDICTHAEVSLASGILEGFEVECCAHGARFDVRTGAVKSMPATEALGTYPVKREGEDIYVDVCS